MSEDTKVEFEISVMEHPATKSRIDAITKLVVEAQSTMTQGVERVGAAAGATSQAQATLTGQIKAFRDAAVTSLDDVRGAVMRLQSMAEQRVEQIVQVVIKGADAPEMAAVKPMAVDVQIPADLQTKFDRVGAQIEQLRQNTNGKPVAVDVRIASDVETKIAGVGSEIDELRVGASAKPIAVDVQLPDDLQTKLNQAGDQIDQLRKSASEPIDMTLNLPANIRNVFKELGDVSVEEANRIEAAFNESISKLPNSVVATTARLREEYAKRAAHQAEAYGKMASDLDAAIEKQGAATERMNANFVKGTKSVVGAAKGFAQLGLLSTESTEAMMKGLVAVEGVVNVLDGAVDLLESVSGGWKAVKQSGEAANKVSEIQKAMMGSQFAGMKAYQGQLAQEVLSANAATAANNRLNASRSVKGGVAAVGAQAVQSVGGQVASQVVGAGATKVVAGAGGAAVGGAVAGAGGAAAGTAATAGAGFMSTTVAGVATGVLGSIAAAGAALAAVSLVAVELSETFSGTAGKVGSLTDTIASGEVSIMASALRLTGMFETTDSIGTQFATTLSNAIDSTASMIPVHGKIIKSLNLFGDVAGLAASSAAVERSQKRLATDKRNNARLDDLASAERVASGAMGQSEFKTFAQTTRLTAEGSGSVDSKLGAEMMIQATAAKELAKYQEAAATAGEAQGYSSKQYREAMGQVKSYQDAITGSMDKQRSLVAENSRIQLDAQSKIQDGLRKQIDLQDTGIEKLTNGYRSAVGNFAKLGTIEKQRALDALSQARQKGGGSLDDSQKDILRSVGTEEANRFADQGDAAEAKQFGFTDQNFGNGFDQQRKQMESVQQTLKAELATTYAVQVKVDTDASKIVREIVTQTNKVTESQNAEILKLVQAELQNQKRNINDQSRYQKK